MKTHRLKVFIKYADAIMNGTKTFEVRKNDRGYEVGDKIVFSVVSNEGISVGDTVRHPLNGATYRIDYILDDFEGLAQKYVALAISKEHE
nr:MAG TPA: activating signal cointegrator [Caudoviricetes sp.]